MDIIQFEFSEDHEQFPFIQIFIKELYGTITLQKISIGAGEVRYEYQGISVDICIVINTDYDTITMYLWVANNYSSCQESIMDYSYSKLLHNCLNRNNQSYQNARFNIRPDNITRRYPLYQLLESIIMNNITNNNSWKGFTIIASQFAPGYSLAGSKLQIEFNDELIHETMPSGYNKISILCAELMSAMNDGTVPETFYVGLPIERMKCVRHPI